MEFLSHFVENLKELLNEQQIEIEDFAAATGINLSEVYRYLRKEYIPKLSNLIKIADAYLCSIDYLLGRIPYPEHTTYHKTPPFSERFRALLKERELSRYRLSLDSEISINRIDDWYHGRCIPSLDKAIKLMEFFEFDTLDCLLGREN